MKKNYVLDTNVFIFDPECVLKFEDNDLYISPVTLKEINNLKNKDGEIGRSARRVKQILDELRNNGSSLKEGLPLGEGKGKFHIIDNEDFSDFLPGMTKSENDDRILAASAYLSKKSKENDIECILVTDDVDMGFLADLIGVKTEHFRNQRVANEKDRYTGRKEIYVPADTITKWYQGESVTTNEELQLNEYVVLKNETNESNSAIGKYNGQEIVPLSNLEEFRESGIYGIDPRNNGQRFLAEGLLADAEDIPLVIGIGSAGTGKTLISLACGLEMVVNQNKYRKILITRANVKMDNEYGYLPGTEEEKISPMLRPFFDNLEQLTKSADSPRHEQKDGKRLSNPVEELFEMGFVKAESLEYMRGRSITDTFIIIDEVQNCTPRQVLSIVSRVGIGSKVVLLGDPEQIDNKLLGKQNNGLVFASERFKGSSLCSQVTLKETECVRSKLAKEAASRLKL